MDEKNSSVQKIRSYFYSNREHEFARRFLMADFSISKIDPSDEFKTVIYKQILPKFAVYIYILELSRVDKNYQGHFEKISKYNIFDQISEHFQNKFTESTIKSFLNCVLDMDFFEMDPEQDYYFKSNKIFCLQELSVNTTNYLAYIEKIDRIIHELDINTDKKQNIYENIDSILRENIYITDWLSALAKNYYKDVKILSKIDLLKQREKDNLYSFQIENSEYFI